MIAPGQASPARFFPICLGALGCGLALAQAGPVLGVPDTLGMIAQILACTLFLVCLAAYLRHLASRPGVVLQDVAALPTRGAVSAGAMAFLLMAAVLLPLSPGLARTVWFLGLSLHFGTMLLVGQRLWRERGAAAPPTPALYLPFVGQITAPIAGVPLGQTLLCTIIFYAALVPAAIIALASLRALAQTQRTRLDRAAQAIHLAPAALFGSAALQLGLPALFFAFFVLALFCATLLVIKAGWLAHGGFYPGWAAFTFPSAAFCGLCLRAEESLPGLGAAYLAWAALATSVAMTLFVLIALARRASA
ncbi:MAG: hypothetical protein AAGC92_14540 [Pseudomonadota bacterium]